MRLRKLAEVAERNAYEELVKDITPRKNVTEPFSSYKDQLGFGGFCCSSSPPLLPPLLTLILFIIYLKFMFFNTNFSFFYM